MQVNLNALCESPRLKNEETRYRKQIAAHYLSDLPKIGYAIYWVRPISDPALFVIALFRERDLIRDLLNGFIRSRFRD